MRLAVFALSTLAFALVSYPLLADKSEQHWDDWDEVEQTSPWQLAGFIEAGFGQFTEHHITEKQQALSELRGQLEVHYLGDYFTLKSKSELLLDNVTESTELKARELNISFDITENTKLIAGRQIITWGTGDYLFLNDLFAKDWQSFFAGREDVYLKAPNDAVRVLHYFDQFTVDFVYAPEFTADNYITGERFAFYSLQQQAIIAPEYFPVTTTDNEQYSLRIATTHKGVEYAVYSYKGYWPTPQGVKLNGRAYFPQLNSYGASVRLPVFSGLLNAEVAVYNSIEDSGGDNAAIANDQLRLLIGYEQELAANFTGAFQAYLEHTKDYSALTNSVNNISTLVEQNRQVYTTRFTYLAMRQTLTSSVFIFYSPTDHDAYIKPSISYRLNDNWQFSAGGNVFFGRDKHTFFGQHQDNSNLWLRARLTY